jgi:N6-adenosine-specific RNA methylase IME4
MAKKYKTIYADPPWKEVGGGKKGGKRGADRHYPLMSTKEIMALPVNEIAAENCHLYLWVTNNFLKDGLKVMEAWGFRYVTMITWQKDKMGLGQYFRGMTEHCLFGVKGVLPYKVKNGKRQQGVTGFYEPRGRHSAKPYEMRKMIQKVSYQPAIELFAREKFKGWDVWGNEVKSDIKL